MWSWILVSFLSNPFFPQIQTFSFGTDRVVEELEEKLDEVVEDQKQVSLIDWITRVFVGVEAIAISALIYLMKTGHLQDWLIKSVEKIKGDEDLTDSIYQKLSQFLSYMGFRTLYFKESNLPVLKEFLNQNQLVLLYRQRKSEDQFLFVSSIQGNVLKVFVLNGQLKKELEENPEQNPFEIFERVSLDDFMDKEKKLSFLVLFKETHLNQNPIFLKIFPEIQNENRKILLGEWDEEKPEF